MHAHDMSWFDVERYLKHDDRAVVPLGSIEQHAYLSLGVDNILSQRVAAEALPREAVHQVAQHGQVRRDAQRDGARVAHLVRRQAVVQAGEHRDAQRLRGVQSDPLRQDVVDAQAEVGVLLDASKRDDGTIVVL